MLKRLLFGGLAACIVAAAIYFRPAARYEMVIPDHSASIFVLDTWTGVFYTASSNHWIRVDPTKSAP